VFCTAPAKYLDTFTSSNQGTVPASGGGTSNFLRADGTFAAPPGGTPASPTTSVQFNNAGAFGGVSTFTYASGTDTLSVGKLVSANFTSAAQGLVPASGGGTTNFLRADGSFAAPPTTAPAGATTQIQFNNASAFGASANFTYATATNTFTVGPAGATTIIETLAPTGSTTAGLLQIRGKNASATNGNGGGLQFTSGNAIGTGSGGGISFTGGANGATGGGFSVLSGQGTSTGGNISIQSGNGTGALGAGGGFLFTSGAGINDGGAFEMDGGQATNGIGGGFLLQSGFSINGTGGDFRFIALGGPLGNGQMYFDTDFGGTVIQLTATTLGAPQLGFYGTVPVSQAAAYTKTYSTASRVIPNATFTNLVTTAATNVAPYGFTTATQADAIATKVTLWQQMC
jgi:hypothetical protein